MLVGGLFGHLEPSFISAQKGWKVNVMFQTTSQYGLKLKWFKPDTHSISLKDYLSRKPLRSRLVRTAELRWSFVFSDISKCFDLNNVNKIDYCYNFGNNWLITNKLFNNKSLNKIRRPCLALGKAGRRLGPP